MFYKNPEFVVLQIIIQQKQNNTRHQRKVGFKRLSKWFSIAFDRFIVFNQFKRCASSKPA
jgi:hypothetical protein